MTPAEKVAAYIRLRDHIKASEDEFKLSMKRPRDAMEKLEAELLDHLNETGGNSLSCDDGTVYKSTATTATVENREAFREFVIEHNLWEAMDIRANKTFAREYMEEKGEILPGLKVTQVATVNIRRS
jgi:hypothetical protein